MLRGIALVAAGACRPRAGVGSASDDGDGPIRLLNGLLAPLSRFNDIVEVVGKYLGLTLIGTMTLVILYQVFMRYVLNDPPTWSEEISRFMMVWMTFLVAPIAYRRGMNVAIETLSRYLVGRVQAALQLVLNALILYFMIEYAEEGIGLAERGLKSKAFTVNVKLFWFYLIVPAGFYLLAAVSVENILRAIKGLVDPASVPKHKPLSGLDAANVS